MPKKLTSADLRHRITLQRPITTANGLGESISAWQDVVTAWAKVEPLQGREYFAAQQMQAVTNHRVAIRYRAGVLATWRVMWRGQPLEIVGDPIEVAGGREWLELMCVSGVRDGRE